MKGIVGTPYASGPWPSIDGMSLPDESSTLCLGARLARELAPPCTVALVGDLGAGKTTLVRGFLRALGVSGPIRSPTYALVESYDTPLGPVHHLDCYRIESLEDFEARGGFDYLNDGAISFVEWPERIAEAARFDGTIELAWAGEGRRVSSFAGGRRNG